jgi:hypothetical protein
MPSQLERANLPPPIIKQRLYKHLVSSVNPKDVTGNTEVKYCGEAITEWDYDT